MFCIFFYAIQDFQDFFQSEDLLQVYFQVKSLQKGHKSQFIDIY